MNAWDDRIMRYWAEQIHVTEEVLHGSGAALRFTSTADDRAVVYTLGRLQVVLLPPRFERMLQSGERQFESFEEAIGTLKVLVDLKWRDFTYYATTPLETEMAGANIRVLTPRDESQLVDLQAQCTRAEVDLAQIGIRDPLVMGYFEQDKLVGAASLLERGRDIFDIGVLTHPGFRGQSIGVKLTVALRNDVTRKGKVAQYITMEKNRGSVRVAEKSSFDLFAVEDGYTLTERA